MFKRIMLEKKRKRIEKEKKLQDFLSLQGFNYKVHREKDYVVLRWTSEREKDSILQKIALTCNRQRDIRRWVQNNILSFVMRFGWEQREDIKRKTFWAKTKGIENVSNTMITVIIPFCFLNCFIRFCYYYRCGHSTVSSRIFITLIQSKYLFLFQETNPTRTPSPSTHTRNTRERK